MLSQMSNQAAKRTIVESLTALFHMQRWNNTFTAFPRLHFQRHISELMEVFQYLDMVSRWVRDLGGSAALTSLSPVFI